MRFYRRADGTVLTGSDCPAGARAARSRAGLFFGRCAAVLLLALGALAGSGCDARPQGGILRNSKLRRIQPFGALLEWLDPAPLRPTLVMGRIAIGPPKPLPPPVDAAEPAAGQR